MEHGDNSSCGVCLRIAEDMICQTNTLSTRIRLEEQTIANYRNWIVYFLLVNCTSCSAYLIQPISGLLSDLVIGLPNIVNNCCFNSAVQAVVSVILKSGKFPFYFKLKYFNKDKLLMKLVISLLKKQHTSSEELRNVLRSLAKNAGSRMVSSKILQSFSSCLIWLLFRTEMATPVMFKQRKTINVHYANMFSQKDFLSKVFLSYRYLRKKQKKRFVFHACKNISNKT